ncbi:MAG: hypothetical protein K8F24_07180, partial [Bacteroidales bacterium]|nr:hypothetical protein [Bacteroidales bacterium]
MKKLLLILTILVIASTGMAQKSERTNAFMYNKNAQYDKAKEAIDKAVVHPRTAEDAKAWMYRGIIYLNLVFSEDYANLSEDPLQESFNSFKKAIELDPDDKLKRSNDIDPRVEAIGQQYFAYGVDDFNAGQNDPNKYKVAANKFHKAYEVAAYVNKIDTLALLNAALASVRAEAYEQALEYYEQLLALDFNESDVYKNMA